MCLLDTSWLSNPGIRSDFTPFSCLFHTKFLICTELLLLLLFLITATVEQILKQYDVKENSVCANIGTVDLLELRVCIESRRCLLWLCFPVHNLGTNCGHGYKFLQFTFFILHFALGIQPCCTKDLLPRKDCHKISRFYLPIFLIMAIDVISNIL